MKKRLIPWLILALALALGLSIHALADAPTPYLRVNGSESSASVAFNEAPVIRIYAPGATAVRLLANRLNTPDDPKSWDRYFDHYEVSLILEENGGEVGNLSVINDEVKKAFPGFHVKQYGFSRFTSFIESFPQFEVRDNSVRLSHDYYYDEGYTGRTPEGENGRNSRKRR